MRVRTLVAAAPLCALALPALAGMSTPVSTTVTLGPLLTYLQPTITEGLAYLVGIGLTSLFAIVGLKANQWFGLKISDAQWAVVHSAADAEVKKLVAMGVTDIATMNVDVKSPIVASTAQAAINQIPDIAKKAGVTPDGMAELVLAKIGAYQASQTVAAPAAKTTEPRVAVSPAKAA